MTVAADGNGGFTATIAVQRGDVLSITALDPWGGVSPAVPFAVKTEASLYFIHSDHLGTSPPAW